MTSKQTDSEQSDIPEEERCPTCEEHGENVRGRYEHRVVIDGRGIYTCPKCGTKWQNADETPLSPGKAGAQIGRRS